LSSDPNRQRPRSSKKQRAVQRDPAARDPGRAGGDARRVTGASTPTRPVGAGRTRAGSTSRSAGGIPTAWLAGIAIVAILAVAGFASGAIKLGGGGAAASPVASTRASSIAAGPTASGATQGTNCPTSQPPAAPAGSAPVVTIETPKGQIVITLNADLSPIAVGNFTALAACGYYDGVVFHRVATLADGTPFVIQGGDPTGTGTGGPGYEIQDEKVTTPYKRGTVAMARTAAPNSVGSQFFIVLDDNDAPVLQSANTYQIIGSVTSGMEAVDAIYAAAGGQELPADPVPMTKVTVGTAPPSPASSPGGSTP
jgi:peptidyl-prolyl cis-trans isomerase B (cyclophilin B)